MSRRPELLCPAGNPEKLRAALRYGADAVYLAGRRFGMRAAADNFDTEEIREAVAVASRSHAKVCLTVNVLPRGEEYPALREFLTSLSGAGLYAVIAADLGVMALVRELLPEVRLHVSTQAGVVSAEAAEQYARLGCSRVVLSRELSLEEIRRIRRRTTRELELEVFIHGSMCVSWSGRCLLSNYLTGRDANHGACAQPCRWEYDLFEISEAKHRDSPLPIEQSSRGTFLMSSKDLCMIRHIPELIESGIDSFKIEGRMKSAYYAAVTANTYRMALDRYLADPASYRFEPAWLTELESVSHRDYDTGFFFDDPASRPCLTSSSGYIREKSYIGVVESYDPLSRRAVVVQRNKLSSGDAAELLSPGSCGKPFLASDLRDDSGAPISSAPHPLMRFSLPLPFPASPGDIIRK